MPGLFSTAFVRCVVHASSNAFDRHVRLAHGERPVSCYSLIANNVGENGAVMKCTCISGTDPDRRPHARHLAGSLLFVLIRAIRGSRDMIFSCSCFLRVLVPSCEIVVFVLMSLKIDSHKATKPQR